MTIPSPVTRPQRAEPAFTMVEIALCLAIIGFALVAIIGVLPTGLNVQKNNREETIIDHDAAVWIDAIRNGAQGYDDLTNYVRNVTNYWAQDHANNALVTGPSSAGYKPDVYDYNGSDVHSVTPPPILPLINGYRIIGLLSTPRYAPLPGGGYQSNYVVANVRAMSGSAVEKAPQDMAVREDIGFSYRMIVENMPYAPFDTNSIRAVVSAANNPFDSTLADINALTNTEPTSLTTAQRQAYWDGVRANRILLGQAYGNSRDLRLTFRWAILPNGETGPGRQTFRCFTGGVLAPEIDPATTQNGPLMYFFRPAVYVRVP